MIVSLLVDLSNMLFFHAKPRAIVSHHSQILKIVSARNYADGVPTCQLAAGLDVNVEAGGCACLPILLFCGKAPNNHFPGPILLSFQGSNRRPGQNIALANAFGKFPHTKLIWCNNMGRA